MHIQHEAENELGRFFYKDGEAEGEITYRLKDGELSLDHTGVDEALEGKGVGKALVMHAAEWAREKGYRIKPYCTFAAAFFKRNPDYNDILIPVSGRD